MAAQPALRCAVVGLTGIGTRHALGLVGDERVTLVAGCDDYANRLLAQGYDDLSLLKAVAMESKGTEDVRAAYMDFAQK
eukprot:SAG31_NODE_19184_length_610_cov_0.671233_1_plen_79_part_00